MGLSDSVLRSVVGKVPYDKWPWGYPITLEGTNNSYWLAYLSEANISFVSRKTTDEILFVGYSREVAMDWTAKRKAKRKELLKKQFHPWDGSHIKLEKYVKNMMHDEDSYEHIETVYWNKGDYLIINMRFRGKNVFGAKIKNYVKAKVDVNTGEVLDILEWE